MMRAVRLVPLVLLVASSLSAAVYHDKRGGISYDIPSWWQAEEREQGVVMMTNDETLVVMIWTPKNQTLKEAVASLDTELSRIIQNAKPDGKPQSGNLNGMETLMLSGRGRINRVRAEWSVIIIDAKSPVFLLAFGETGKYEKHAEALQGFVKTIKRAR